MRRADRGAHVLSVQKDLPVPQLYSNVLEDRPEGFRILGRESSWVVAMPPSLPPDQLQVTVGQTGGQTAAARASEQQARRQAESEEAIKADPFVRTLLEEFGATILPDSIKPLDGEKSS